jgi:hypothetical protein
VTTTGFDMRIEEAAGYNGPHTREEIDWIAISNSSSLDGGQVDTDNTWTLVNFDSPYPSKPVVFAQIASENNSENSQIDIRNLTKDSFEVRVSEDPRGFDDIHPVETISWTAFDYNRPELESGVINLDNNPSEFYFNRPFDQTPAMLAEIITENGSDTVDVDILELNSSRFTLRLEEDLKGGWNGNHFDEKVNWIGISQDNTIGTNISFNQIDDTIQSISFTPTYTTQPFFFGEINSENGSDTVNIDITELTKDFVNIYLEEDVRLGWNGNHFDEKVGLVHFDTAPFGEVDKTDINHNWTTINFSTSFSTTPKVFAEIISENGPDTVQIDIRNVTTNSFEIRLEEEPAGYDGTHAFETINWWAFE